ncbi:DUF3243 domain-containing protein [Marininema halotolerans]|uniref:DUF3243 domain-containing protein n=1 Tax=Marininema halotolerans TaxID=1155944 RepID=A0A1I6R5V8_9BACL|nr:DUF3243 domain-containing protein [Marininema halotolerans]SFS60065.1 Protein of unknown function [Marininema halotolerans]
MSVLNDFDGWKNFLSDRVNQAQTMGMDQDSMSNVAYELGDYLSQSIDPKNNEERLLKELWDCADEQEQRTMANLMVKMVSDGKQH